MGWKYNKQQQKIAREIQKVKTLQKRARNKYLDLDVKITALQSQINECKTTRWIEV
jgi:serine/threonine-protein kinase RIO1